MTASRLVNFLSLRFGLIACSLTVAQCGAPYADSGQTQYLEETQPTQIRRAVSADERELFPTPTALNVPFQSAALNDVARFLAGMPALSGQDVFASQRRSALWKEHAARMDHLWSEFAWRHGQRVANWASTHMGDLRSANSVFYPFSGPDFLFAHLFYPHAETYLLCGLESCEPLPDWKSLNNDEIAAGLNGLVNGLDNILQFSYFITKEMRQDFQSTRFRGVLPSFLVFLARTGHIVDSVNAVRLQPDGSPVIYATGESTVPGLFIRLHGNGGPKRLFYFRQDLADGASKPGSPFFRFASSLGRPAALAKSASYLMHEGYFSNVRNYILNHCSGIVQDPSGVPYRSFGEKGWKVDLFGNYTGTIPLFHQYEQADLIQASQVHSQPIDFGIGYLTDYRTTCLMVWRR